MESFVGLLITVIVIHALAVMSPGPDFLIVLKNALSRSRKDGIATASGVALAIGIHVVYCAAGLALIISQSILAFTLLKWIGGAYLFYLGIRAILSKGTTHTHIVNKHISQSQTLFKSFREGFVTNALNPKASLFFLSLFTLVISSTTPLSWIAIFGIVMIVNTWLWFSLVAYCVTISKVRTVYERFSVWVDRLFGVALAVLGVKLILSNK